MNAKRLLAVFLLLASLLVIGSMSTTLQSTIESTPDDVIDVDTDKLPFLGEGASDVASSYKQSDDAEQASERSTNADQPGPGGGSSQPDDGPPPDNQQGSQQSGEGGESGGSAGGGSQGGTGGSGQDESGQEGGDDPMQSLWALLAQVLSVLLALLAIALVLAAGVVLVRYRDRIRERLEALADRYGVFQSSADEPAPIEAGEEASSVVERAWGAMLDSSPASPDRNETPRECASAMIEAGADREPVEKLTGLYEQVRYGARPVTPDQASQALVWRRAVGDGNRSPPDPGVRDADDGRRGRTTMGDGGSTPNEREGST